MKRYWTAIVVSTIFIWGAQAAEIVDFEGMKADDYAVAPAATGASDAITDDTNNPAACLSADTVSRYEKSAAKTVAAVKKAKTPRGKSLRTVSDALAAGGLLPNRRPLATSAKDAGPALAKKGFVNLMECKEWRNKIKNGDGAVPLGAVLIYSGGKHGDARIKTPEGCLGSNSKSCANPGRTLTGVYVKMTN